MNDDWFTTRTSSAVPALNVIENEENKEDNKGTVPFGSRAKRNRPLIVLLVLLVLNHIQCRNCA